MTQYKAKANVNAGKLIKKGELISEQTYGKLPDWLKIRFERAEADGKEKGKPEPKDDKKNEDPKGEEKEPEHVTDNPDRQFMNKKK